jgi:DNA-binding response OmpR family regulator
LIAPERLMEARSASILIVEDDQAVAEMFGLGLRLAGFDVALAGDSGIAVSLANQARFDLVLLDLQLPTVDGLETLKLFRSQPSTRDLPVVMFTNSGDDAVRLQARNLGITDWVLKSRTTPGELAKRIGAWLAKEA